MDDEQTKTYPWQVSLGHLQDVPKTQQEREAQPVATKLAAHYCNGVLLNDRWVLTTAQCVLRNETVYGDDIGIGLGHDLVEMYDKGRLPVVTVYYGGPQDIGLLQLRQPVPTTPACLAAFWSPEFGGNLTSIGWANTPYLKQTMVKDVTTDHCRADICTSTPEPCMKTGGSLVWENTVIGIYGTTNPYRCDAETAYMSVFHSLNWIKGVTKSNFCVVLK